MFNYEDDSNVEKMWCSGQDTNSPRFIEDHKHNCGNGRVHVDKGKRKTVGLPTLKYFLYSDSKITCFEIHVYHWNKRLHLNKRLQNNF